MTTCQLITKPITRMVEKEGKTLDEIAESICPTVKYGREKIIRIIRDFLGDDYLIKHAETLSYDVEKATLARKRKPRPHKKSLTEAPSRSKHEPSCPSEESVCEDFTLIEAVRLLIEQFGYDAVLETVKQEGENKNLQIKEN